jgi:hypothetical protein
LTIAVLWARASPTLPRSKTGCAAPHNWQVSRTSDTESTRAPFAGQGPLRPKGRALATDAIGASERAEFGKQSRWFGLVVIGMIAGRGRRQSTTIPRSDSHDLASTSRLLAADLSKEGAWSHLLNLAIAAGALAASPAIGGKALSDWLSGTLGLPIQGSRKRRCNAWDSRYGQDHRKRDTSAGFD